MRFEWTKKELAFRDEVRDFLKTHYPTHLRGRNIHHFTKEDFLQWHKILAQKKWSAPLWPKHYGGQGFTLIQNYIFERECALFGAAISVPFGIHMLGPVLQAFGTKAQKEKFLPRILSGEDFWCQGYTESHAGSDLASLKTYAQKSGNHYIVNGHKIWTTMGHFADWIFCLVRTHQGKKPQEGISFLLIDMKSEGVELCPIPLADLYQEVNEIFFRDVKVPEQNLVGREGLGWSIAKFLLGKERYFLAQTARARYHLEILKSHLRGFEDKKNMMRKALALDVRLKALEATELRALRAEEAEEGGLAESSILKVQGTKIQQDIAQLKMEAAGLFAMECDILLPHTHSSQTTNKPHRHSEQITDKPHRHSEQTTDKLHRQTSATTDKPHPQTSPTTDKLSHKEQSHTKQHKMPHKIQTQAQAKTQTQTQAQAQAQTENQNQTQTENQTQNQTQPNAENLFSGAMQDYCNQRKVSIYGGTNEVQYNIIAKHILGL